MGGSGSHFSEPFIGERLRHVQKRFLVKFMKHRRQGSGLGLIVVSLVLLHQRLNSAISRGNPFRKFASGSVGDVKDVL